MIVTFHILFLVLKEFYGVERVAVPKTSNRISSSAPNPKHQETLVSTRHHNDQQQRYNPEHKTRDPRKRPRPFDRSAENEGRDPYEHQRNTTNLSDAPVTKRTLLDDSLPCKVLCLWQLACMQWGMKGKCLMFLCFRLLRVWEQGGFPTSALLSNSGLT